MIFTFLNILLLSKFSISNHNKKSSIPKNLEDYQIEKEQSQNYEDPYQLNDFHKPPIAWIVISAIIGAVFILIIILSICACCKRSRGKKVSNSTLNNQNEDSSLYPQDINQQIYQQNLQQQYIQQQQILNQHNLQQQQIYQQNLQQQQQFYQNYQ